MYSNPHKQAVKNVQDRIVFFYVLNCFLVTLGTTVALYTEWTQRIDITGAEMTRDNLVYQNLLISNIADSLRLLRLSSKKIATLSPKDFQNHQQLHSILKEAKKTFSIFNEDRFGLLLVTDAYGTLIARSDTFQTTPINFSDRYWFQEAKKQQQAPFIIGPLLKARTTGEMVSHVSQAILNKEGRLIGVIAIQIEAKKTQAQTLNTILEKVPAQRKTLNQSSEIVWAQPNNENINSNSGVKYKSSDCSLVPDINGWIVKGDQLVSCTQLLEIGIFTISQKPLKQILTLFIEDKIPLLIYGFLTFVPFSLLVRKFYMQVGELEQIKVISNTDTLTGLHNRLAFDQEYKKLLAHARRNQHPFSVLFIDIDFFKRCNDAYGHENGDIILNRIAKTIDALMKRPQDLFARWGGEEFVLALPDTNRHGAIVVAERILKIVRQTPISLLHGYSPIHITVSIGIASSDTLNHSVSDNLVDQADQAMYRAKRAGRDCYSV